MRGIKGDRPPRIAVPRPADTHTTGRANHPKTR